MSNDSLGDRMKRYEDAFRHYLPPRTNTIIRVDGKAFHTYTKGCKRPFDNELMSDMDGTALELCQSIQGVKLAYIQSDEISLWLTDYDDINTSAWFDGNIQKIVSVSASIATAAFNDLRANRDYATGANFDARVWTMADITEVANYFLWRSQDASRNSVQMVARSHYSQKELHGKNISQLQEMIFRKGQNWNDLSPYYKCGRIALKTGTATKGLNWEIVNMAGYDFTYWSTMLASQLPQI